MDQLKLSATYRSLPCLVMMLQCPIPAFQLAYKWALNLQAFSSPITRIVHCTSHALTTAKWQPRLPATTLAQQAPMPKPHSHRDHMVSLPPLAIKSHKELIGTGWLQGEWDGERVGHWEKGEESKEKEKEEKWRDKGYGLVKLRGKIFIFMRKREETV